MTSRAPLSIESGSRIVTAESEGSIGLALQSALLAKNIRMMNARTSSALKKVVAQEKYDALRINDRHDSDHEPVNSHIGLETLAKYPGLAERVSDRVVMSVMVPWKTIRRNVRKLQEANPRITVVLVDAMNEVEFWKALADGNAKIEDLPGYLDPDSIEFDYTI